MLDGRGCEQGREKRDQERRVKRAALQGEFATMRSNSAFRYLVRGLWQTQENRKEEVRGWEGTEAQIKSQLGKKGRKWKGKRRKGRRDAVRCGAAETTGI